MIPGLIEFFYVNKYMYTLWASLIFLSHNLFRMYVIKWKKDNPIKTIKSFQTFDAQKKSSTLTSIYDICVIFYDSTSHMLRIKKQKQLKENNQHITLLQFK